MTAWARWCINHNLRALVYLACFLCLPLYLIYYIPEALGDWVRELKAIKRVPKEKQNATD